MSEPTNYFIIRLSMVVWVNLVLKRIVVADFTVSDNSPIQDFVHLADHTQPTYTSFNPQIPTKPV